MSTFTEEVLASLLANGCHTFSKYTQLQEDLHGCFKLRPLSSDDYLKGYLDLISDDDVDIVSCKKKFQEYYSVIRSKPEMYFTVVVEDCCSSKIIGAGSLVIEQKFIHETALRGRMESIYVSEEYRRRGIGSLILETLTLLGKRLGCYKTTSNCPRDLLEFCEGMNYVEEAQQNYLLVTCADHDKKSNM